MHALSASRLDIYRREKVFKPGEKHEVVLQIEAVCRKVPKRPLFASLQTMPYALVRLGCSRCPQNSAKRMLTARSQNDVNRMKEYELTPFWPSAGDVFFPDGLGGIYWEKISRWK